MTIVNNQLSHLQTSGLVRLAQTTPDLEYLFRHALVQDAAYQSLLMADRRQFHRTIGETLETLYPERQSELAAALGHHFELAEEYARALPCFIQAADHAAESFANEEAIALYGKAIDIARKVEVAEDIWPALCQKRGRAIEITSDYELALSHYQEMEALALERGDKRLELTAVIGQTTIYTTPTSVSDTNLGASRAEHASALAKELNDKPAQLRILWTLLNLYGNSNNVTQAFAIGEEALALAKSQGMREEEAYLSNDLCRYYQFTGRLSRAETLAAQARFLWRDLNNLSMLTDCLALSSSIACEKGELQQSLAFADEGIQIARSTNNLQAEAYTRVMTGMIYTHLGRANDALDTLTMAIDYARQLKFVPIEVFATAYLAHAYARYGDLTQGLAAAQAAYVLAKNEYPYATTAGVSMRALVQSIAGKNEDTKELIATAKANPLYQTQALLYVPWVLEAEARVFLQEGEAQAALDVSRSLQTALEEFGALTYMPKTLLLQAKALAALGRWDEARQAAEQGGKTAVFTQNVYARWELAAFQAQLQIQQGNREEAEALRHEAETIINEIAANCPPDLRESFLNMPAVTAVYP